MHRLAKHGMKAVSIDDFVASINGKIRLPDGAFLLTFDDGFLGVYEHAAPLLKELGWPATVFLVSGLIGGQDEWCKSENPSGQTYPLMGLREIEELTAAGFSFHSHTRHHPHLPLLTDRELEGELAGSREELASLLDRPVEYLAYPYGQYDERVIEAARAVGYTAAFSVQPGFNRVGIDPYRIRRLDVFGTDTPSMLLRKIKLGSNDGSLGHAARYYVGRLVNHITRLAR